LITNKENLRKLLKKIIYKEKPGNKDKII